MPRLVHVLEIGNEVNLSRGIQTRDVIRTAGASWANPGGIQPRRMGLRRVFLAIGPEIIPWPSTDPSVEIAATTPEGAQPGEPSPPVVKGDSCWDVMDDGSRVRITPEYLDWLLQQADNETWMKGVRGISTWDRIIHLAAGAAAGMVLTVAGLKLLGWGASYLSGSPPPAPVATPEAVTAGLALLAVPMRGGDRNMGYRSRRSYSQGALKVRAQRYVNGLLARGKLRLVYANDTRRRRR